MSVQRPKARARKAGRREQGVALVMVLTVIGIITALVAELTQNTATAFQVAVSERDRLKAEYLAKSGINLTRLLISKETEIRRVVAPMYSMVLHRSPPQMNVWTFADDILAPFANLKGAKLASGPGLDFGQMKGLTDTGGTFEVVALPENTRLNVNIPLAPDPGAQRSLAMQLYALTGGFQTQSPYDSMFNKIDSDGQLTTRLDIVSDVIDWWDPDDQRTVFDPGALTITAAGGEDDVYSRFADPYVVKNAAFDSLEELRMVRGITDDFWATFVQSDPDDPRTRRMTIYGQGAVNPNEAPPQVLLARVCSFVPEQPLCNDQLQAMAFTQLLNTARSILPIPWFTTATDFLNFIQGPNGKSGATDLYPMLLTMLGKDMPLMKWVPINIPADRLAGLQNAFVTRAGIFTIQATGRVGHTSVRVATVVNFDDRWTPPPPAPGRAMNLGIVHHYRID